MMNSHVLWWMETVFIKGAICSFQFQYFCNETTITKWSLGKRKTQRSEFDTEKKSLLGNNAQLGRYFYLSSGSIGCDMKINLNKSIDCFVYHDLMKITVIHRFAYLPHIWNGFAAIIHNFSFCNLVREQNQEVWFWQLMWS